MCGRLAVFLEVELGAVDRDAPGGADAVLEQLSDVHFQLQPHRALAA